MSWPDVFDLQTKAGGCMVIINAYRLYLINLNPYPPIILSKKCRLLITSLKSLQTYCIIEENTINHDQTFSKGVV